MGAKKILIIFAVPCLIGLLAYRYLVSLDFPIPDGFSPQSTKDLKIMLTSIKLFEDMAETAYSVGIGSSASDNNYRVVRFIMNRMGDQEGPDPNIKEVDLDFDGVPVRLYEPVGRSGSLPGFVWYHGGGWVLGSLDSTAGIVRKLSKELNVVVVSVDYRLAPDHLFPAAYEDCVTATKYFISNAEKFEVDRDRIAIGGDSAGGNLAAVVALKLRDESFQPTPKLQVLVYPVGQGLDFQLPSYLKNADGPLLSRQAMVRFVLTYLRGNNELVDVLLNNEHVSAAVKKNGLPHIDVNKLPSKYLVDYKKPDVEVGNETLWNEMKDKLLNPYFSPLVADRLDNLPPAYVFTAEHDPLRDEGILYARRLEESGVKVMHHHSDIGIHGIMSMTAMMPEAENIFKEMIDMIRDSL